MLKTFKNMFGPTMKERLDLAIAKCAELHGEAEVARVKADYYTNLVLAIDPMKDHWSFAHARHSQLEHQQSHEVLTAATTAARVKVEELIETALHEQDAT